MPVVLLLRLRDREMQRQIGWIRGNSSKDKDPGDSVDDSSRIQEEEMEEKKMPQSYKPKRRPSSFSFLRDAGYGSAPTTRRSLQS